MHVDSIAWAFCEATHVQNHRMDSMLCVVSNKKVGLH